MKYLNFLLVLGFIFNKNISNVLAGNHNYIISIERNEKDANYDEASQRIQEAIDELVNDRMNDIYNIISDHEETYVSENGQQDKKLKELEEIKLRKRHNSEEEEKEKEEESHHSLGSGNPLPRKFRFINRNRPRNGTLVTKRSEEALNEGEEEITLESELVSHISPVLNYYTVVAYLSDDIVDEVKKLPNVIAVERSRTLKNFASSSKKYYNLNQIRRETQWSEVRVQENEFYEDEMIDTHLSLISQSKFTAGKKISYDNNYYYPSQAGKGIDIFLIDNGLWINSFDFDTYHGERKISCDVLISNGHQEKVKNKGKCAIVDSDGSDYPDHGIMVSAVSAGTLHGVAKKANIHMIAAEYTFEDILSGLDYIKQHGKPYKTVISISRGGYVDFSQTIQNKINELTEAGYIIVAAVGNESDDACRRSTKNGRERRYLFAGYDNVIRVGAIEGAIDRDLQTFYNEASYSNYGSCVDIYGPGYVTYTNSFYPNEVIDNNFGTSCATPVVSGVIASILSENSGRKYTFQKMKEELLRRSLKNVIHPRHDHLTNRLVNNGKTSVYRPFRCDDPSGQYQCSRGCCSREGLCISTGNMGKIDRCLVEHGCQSHYGKCLSLQSDGSAKGAFTKKEKQNIILASCSYEIQQMNEKCRFQPFEVTEYSKEKLPLIEKYCKIYRENHCKEYFKSPLSYLPGCQSAVKNYGIKLEEYMDEDTMKKDAASNNFVCSRRRSGKICPVVKLFFSVDYTQAEYDKAFHSSCEDKECRETYLAYSKYYYNYKDKSNSLYRDKDLKKSIDYLSSQQCKAKSAAEKKPTPKKDTTKKETSKNPTSKKETKKETPKNPSTKKANPGKKATSSKKPTKVITVTTTTTKKATTKKGTNITKKTVKSHKTQKIPSKKVPTSPISGRCGPKYGACSKANSCCSRYGYCGTTKDYCGTGCQPKYGLCQ